MHFTKMQGCGNDFVVLDGRDVEIGSMQERVMADFTRRLCNRHFGIGADGVLILREGRLVRFAMEIRNADGSRAQICGNGLRCMGKWLWDRGLAGSRSIPLECDGQTREVEALEGETAWLGEKEALNLRVDMGIPKLEGKPRRVLGWTVNQVSMGNPHAVVLLDEENPTPAGKGAGEELLRGEEVWPVRTAGPLLEGAKDFPEGTNVEFVRVLDRGRIALRVWERGAGETMACGSGACAAAAVCMQKGLTDEKITVTLLGGMLWISRDKVTGRFFMTGPAVTVFEGEIRNYAGREEKNHGKIK